MASKIDEAGPKEGIRESVDVILETTPTAISLPVADFSYAPDILNPLLIHFMDLSTGYPFRFVWDFGDEGASTEENPSHLFAL